MRIYFFPLTETIMPLPINLACGIEPSKIVFAEVARGASAPIFAQLKCILLGGQYVGCPFAKGQNSRLD